MPSTFPIRPQPLTPADMIDEAKAFATARAQDILEGVDPKYADALEYLIVSALMQFYSRGGNDALDAQRREA